MALLAVGVLTPRPAQATCGNYVVKGSGATADLQWLLQYGTPGEAHPFSVADPAPAAPRERPGRCEGPSCSRRDGLPTTTGLVGVVRAAHWAILVIPPGTDFAGAMPHAGGEGDATPLHRPGTIFHPPRPAHFVG